LAVYTHILCESW